MSSNDNVPYRTADESDASEDAGQQAVDDAVASIVSARRAVEALPDFVVCQEEASEAYEETLFLLNAIVAKHASENTESAGLFAQAAKAAAAICTLRDGTWSKEDEDEDD
jgi:hypothetical protein